MYTAVIRRLAGGVGTKTAKRGGGDLFILDTSTQNLQTFFRIWPRHLTTYLCYGRSARAELTHPSAGGPLALGAGARRGYARLGPGAEQAELADAVSLSTPGGGARSAILPVGDSVAEPPLAGAAAAIGTRMEQKQPASHAPAEPQPQPEPSVDPASPPPPKPRPKVTLHSLRLKHARAQPISMVTAYDYPSARLADAAGVDVLLVGDSLGMVVLGRDDTTDVTMDEMVHHCRAARQGSERALVVGDLPFGSCVTPLDAARNATRLVKEGRVDAVKIEGGRRMVEQVRAIIDAGVAVVGHIGLTPQSYAALGGYRVQGNTAEAAATLLDEARALEAAGVVAVVLELVPAPVATAITERLNVPTVGIGAGGGTSGQVQVFHDVLGLYDKLAPKFVRQFGQFERPVVEALSAYTRAVDSRDFPADDHAFEMESGELRKFEAALDEADARAADALAAKNGAARRDARPAQRAARADPLAGRNGLAHANGVAHANGLGESNGLLANGFSPAAAAEAAAKAAEAEAAAVRVASATEPVVVRTIKEWRELEASGALPARSLGLVPTMGALHAGHLSLLRRAQAENPVVAASLFVNPKQFAPHEDLDVYPRPWEADLAALSSLGVDFVFAPEREEMYPPHRPAALAPYIDLAGVDETTAEGASRPGFFRGVATVVAKLLNITRPKRVYFGQKDGMQCVVVRRLIDDFDFGVDLVIGDTVREDDGLAMSSRNVYLSDAQRAAAPAVYASLAAVRDAYAGGERSVCALRAAALGVLEAANGSQLEPSARLDLDYLSIASGASGQEYEGEGADGRLPAAGSGEATLASIAVKLGTTRLIDNVLLE